MKNRQEEIKKEIQETTAKFRKEIAHILDCAIYTEKQQQEKIENSVTEYLIEQLAWAKYEVIREKEIWEKITNDQIDRTNKLLDKQ